MENKDQPKIVKVTMEYTDHFIVYEGKEAVKLIEIIDGMTVFSAIHGNNPFDKANLKFQTIKK